MQGHFLHTGDLMLEILAMSLTLGKTTKEAKRYPVSRAMGAKRIWAMLNNRVAVTRIGLIFSW